MKLSTESKLGMALAALESIAKEVCESPKVEPNDTGMPTLRRCSDQEDVILCSSCRARETLKTLKDSN